MQFRLFFIFYFSFKVTDGMCEFQAAFCLLKPQDSKVRRHFFLIFYIPAHIAACLSLYSFCLPSRNKARFAVLKDIFKGRSQVFVLRYTGLRRHWNTLIDSGNLSGAGEGLEEPQPPHGLSVLSAGLPKPPRSFPLCTIILHH